MPSTDKTPNYGLNRWIGTDKPKKDDFNSDNQKIDEALHAHAGDTVAHVTQAERVQWSTAGVSAHYGGYTGNETDNRQISLSCSFTPSFGWIWPVDYQPVSVDSGHNTQYCFGFFSSGGSNLGLSLNGKTLTVRHIMQPTDFGVNPLYNIGGVEYRYAVFP